MGESEGVEVCGKTVPGRAWPPLAVPGLPWPTLASPARNALGPGPGGKPGAAWGWELGVWGLAPREDQEGPKRRHLGLFLGRPGAMPAPFWEAFSNGFSKHL